MVFISSCKYFALEVPRQKKLIAFEWRQLTDKTLKAVAQFCLLAAISSQCALGYYGARLYNNSLAAGRNPSSGIICNPSLGIPVLLAPAESTGKKTH